MIIYKVTIVKCSTKTNNCVPSLFFGTSTDSQLRTCILLRRRLVTHTTRGFESQVAFKNFYFSHWPIILWPRKAQSSPNSTTTVTIPCSAQPPRLHPTTTTLDRILGKYYLKFGKGPAEIVSLEYIFVIKCKPPAPTPYDTHLGIMVF